MNQQRTIWIIDDTYEDLYIAQVMLRKANPELRVTAFQHPEIAYRQLVLYHQHQQPLPDAILLDLNMPVMSGFEFLESSEKEINNLPPVFIVTSSADEQDKIRASKYNSVKRFYTKPLLKSMVEDISKAIYNAMIL